MIGWPPSEFWQATYCEFRCACSGYQMAQGHDEASAALPDKAQELMEFTAQFPEKSQSLRKPTNGR